MDWAEKLMHEKSKTGEQDPPEPKIEPQARRLPSRRAKRFLRGPIPLPWLTVASQLGGLALNASVAIWYRAGIERSRTVKLSMPQAQLFGINDRKARKMALDRLKKSGLIRVELSCTKSPLITILESDFES